MKFNMERFNFYFISTMLLFISAQITNDIFFSIMTLLFCILTILSLFMPSSNTCDIESFENNLVNVTFKGRKIKVTKELKEAYKRMRQKEDEFYSKF